MEEWTVEHLREAVDAQGPLHQARPGTITARRLERAGPDGESLLVDLEVRDQGRTERWRLTFDGWWTELSTFLLDAAVLVLCANLEEWWDTRLGEPDPPWLTVERLG